MEARRRETNAPVGVDPSRASIARMYDFVLGGKDHYQVDRDELARLQRVLPEVADLALENRRYLIRVCRFLAERAGVDQYLDCGSGLPTTENVHQVVQRVEKLSKVVYVDNDPVVVAHGHALLEENDRTRFISGDIFEPETILGHDLVREHLDWRRPIALMFVATLHHYQGDRHRPADIMREYVDALPSGSYVAISHLFDPGEGGDHDTVDAFQRAVASGSLGGATARTEQEIEELLPGLEIVDPGIVLLANWWPDGPSLKPLNSAQRLIAGVVARKL
ncbi:SAM-dependent methyltransferase [Amycolatopsis sp., V23-08]|uniref:SAM-dependent methyltransferase n=1 Tax=Amycolatopsis heterodermiae TaxID=3110235 RepID=A0ABU5QZS4_9PSEU|nr:SAM-dependent methyltransferase [Amycolatopsis sp., V23-08]MEA5359445.1 SAM-dependent methyltransferase [Amycolatopsis sp., V23-08]